MFTLFSSTQKRKFHDMDPTCSEDLEAAPVRKKRKLLKEEKAIIRALREEYRADANAFLLERAEEEPTAEDVEILLDSIIEVLERKGEIQSMLNEYLQEKIAEARKRAGLTSTGSSVDVSKAQHLFRKTPA